MSRDFTSESSTLGRYPGWHRAGAQEVDSRLGPQNTLRPADQCLSASCLFPVGEEISTGIESSDLETCPWPQIV